MMTDKTFPHKGVDVIYRHFHNLDPNLSILRKKPNYWGREEVNQIKRESAIYDQTDSLNYAENFPS